MGLIRKSSPPNIDHFDPKKSVIGPVLGYLQPYYLKFQSVILAYVHISRAMMCCKPAGASMPALCGINFRNHKNADP